MKAFLKRLREKNWTIKVVPGSRNEMAVLHFTLLDLVRVGFVASLTFMLVFGYFVTRKTQETAEFQSLKTELQVKQDQLNAARVQQTKVDSILLQKANKMEVHLKTLRKQEESIRKILGTKLRTPRPTGKNEMAFRYSGMSSRGASSYSALAFRLASLQRQIGEEEQDLHQTRSAAIGRHQELEHVPSIYPVDGIITSGFGYRSSPFGEGSDFHPGIDIGASWGTEVHAAAAGICIFSGWDEGFGYTIKIDHGNGIVTQYSHCSTLLAREGEQLTKGETIARVGSTGYSTGPHLHYQVFSHGRLVNPLRFLPVRQEG